MFEGLKNRVSRDKIDRHLGKDGVRLVSKTLEDGYGLVITPKMAKQMTPEDAELMRAYYETLPNDGLVYTLNSPDEREG